MMFNYPVKKFIKDNRWLILVSIFFILWKFFLIQVLFNDRSVLPEPDDSYIYIAHIDSVAHCSHLFFCKDPYYSFDNHRGYEYLSYRIIFGEIANLLEISSEQVFFLSFFIGTVLAYLAFLYFLRQMRLQKSTLTFALFSLALYHGSVYYHGFWWVTPIFFSVILFFFILGVLLADTLRHRFIIALLLTPLLVFSHPTGIYMTLFLPLILGVIAFTEQRSDWQRPALRIGFITLTILMCYVPVAIHLHLHSVDGNPRGIENIIIQKIAPKVNSSLSPSTTVSTPVLENYYFKWLFLHSPMGWLVFGIIIFLNILSKQRRIIVIFSCLLLLTVTANAFHEDGYRFLALLWPATYILYSIGCWEGFQRLQKLSMDSSGKKHLLLFAGILGLLLFTTISMLYAYLFNDYMNRLENVSLPDEAITFLEKSTCGPIYSSEKLINAYLNLTPLRGRITDIPEDATVFLSIDRSHTTRSIHESKLYTLYTFFANYLKLKSDTLPERNHQNLALEGKTQYREPGSLQKFGDALIFYPPKSC